MKILNLAWLRGPKKQADPGISWNDGKPMRLRTPFTTIVIYDGAIQLRSDDGAVLLVPRNAGAYLSGIIADSESPDDTRPPSRVGPGSAAPPDQEPEVIG